MKRQQKVIRSVFAAGLAAGVAIAVSQLTDKEIEAELPGIRDTIASIAQVDRQRALIVGDSISESKNVRFGGSWENHLGWCAHFAINRPDLYVDCYGITGEKYSTWDPAITDGYWQTYVEPDWPDVLILMIGINDAAQGGQASVSLAEGMIGDALAGGTSYVILVTENFRDPISGGAGIPARDQVIDTEETSQCATGPHAGPSLICVNFGPTGNEMTYANGLVSADGIHPSPAGYSFVATTIAAAVPTF